jgi:hypothetical protein
MRKNVMNERIRELNLQAMSIVMNGSDPDGDVDKMYIPSEFTKKFAELIVKECTEVLLKWKGEPFPFDEDLAVSLIKEHFSLK